jgi:hypothetical protein
MEVYVPRSITWQCDINNKPDLEDISSYTGNDYDITGQRLVNTNGVNGSKTLQVGWNKIWFSQTANTTYGLTNYSTNWGIVTTNETAAIDIKIRKIKGEVIAAGETIQPTIWCPNAADASNTAIEYDCSGFGNNGTRTGVFTLMNNAPKYGISTYMSAAATISHTRCLDNTNQEWTCTAWVKPTVAGNYQNLNNFNESNRLYHGTYPLLYLNSGTNDYYNYGNLALPVNQWSHIAFVFKNSTGTKLIYINGVNHTNTSGPNKTSTPKGIPDTVIIGGGNYDGGLCDYREYATALSADDIFSLYQNNAYIDSSGTIYGKIRD